MSGPFVDEDTAALLTEMAQAFAGAPADPTVEERRAGLAYVADLYGPVTSSEALSAMTVEDIMIAGPGGRLPLRLYYPPRTAQGRSQVRPAVVVHIHGGGWVLGDPDSYGKVCAAYCAAGGFILIDVNYRRAPEHVFPAAIDDCVAALDWAAKNARRLGGDPSRLIVTGDSAGGNLAAAACLKTKARLALQVLVYPVISARASADYKSRGALGDGRYFLREFDIKRAETEYLPDPSYGEEMMASPIVAPVERLRRVPPALIITASLDPLRDEAIAYAARLEAAGVNVRHEEAQGTIHGFVLFAGWIAAGRKAIDTIARAVAEAVPVRQSGWFGG
ncbi:hypothetical protein AEAC466_14800 [Asticcacaulis sp. AC466]|uniref:alpha/beta hydrolase n=1 Tax=Asticcacaulis sp. AC466 TaxID=1282362 RepID=UPI0003C40207|nr:alpha/beta hydrolase [Asticcacaulis sp. AC466]ESQ83129.1 hypothetical protein AEAC466_14800 [Asticcacaulis sp. AC466]